MSDPAPALRWHALPDGTLYATSGRRRAFLVPRSSPFAPRFRIVFAVRQASFIVTPAAVTTLADMQQRLAEWLGADPDEPGATWRREPPSREQLAFLCRHDRLALLPKTRGEAADAIAEISTRWEARCIRRALREQAEEGCAP